MKAKHLLLDEPEKKLFPELNNHSMDELTHIEMHVDHKYVGEIQNLEYHGTLLNGN